MKAFGDVDADVSGLLGRLVVRIFQPWTLVFLSNSKKPSRSLGVEMLYLLNPVFAIEDSSYVRSSRTMSRSSTTIRKNMFVCSRKVVLDHKPFIYLLSTHLLRPAILWVVVVDC